jgi:hypothetical protein
MSILQTTTTSFKVQLLQGVHNFSTNTFKIALYTGNADLNASTTAYSTANEITGAGYTAGGNTLVVLAGTPTYGTTTNGLPVAYVSFYSSVWSNASFTTRAALIYNTSQSNASVAVLDFGADKSASGSTFTITFPTADANSAIIRIA